ncbi:MAG: hypothetical protein SPL13_04585 [Clostridia bacterium]|nr:hypothetical protein [Clostridia bacterium]
MKNIRKLLIVILALLCAFSLAFAVACDDKSADKGTDVIDDGGSGEQGGEQGGEGGGETEQDYLVIGWYDKTSTSGLDAEQMAEFETALKLFLAENGATLDDLAKVRINPYGEGGSVQDLTADVIAAGNVDILLGVGGNIDGETDGNDYLKDYVLEKVGGIDMGLKTRYIARLTDNEVVNAVFSWIQTEDGRASLVPEAQARAHYLVLGWYAADTEGGTSGLTQEIIDNFEVALKDYLQEQGATEAQLNDVIIRSYIGSVGEVGVTINTDGDVDVLIGVGANITSKGGVATAARNDSVAMGGKTRSVARLNSDEITVLVYNWLVAGSASESLAPIETL